MIKIHGIQRLQELNMIDLNFHLINIPVLHNSSCHLEDLYKKGNCGQCEYWIGIFVALLFSFGIYQILLY
jgi:hypothetical protein